MNHGVKYSTNTFNMYSLLCHFLLFRVVADKYLWKFYPPPKKKLLTVLLLNYHCVA